GQHPAVVAGVHRDHQQRHGVLREPLDTEMSQPLTVGQLAAELALYHPDTPVEVYVPDGADSYRVLPIVSAGLGEALPDEVFGSSLVRSWSRLRGVTPRRSGVTVASRRGAIARSSRVPSRSWASSVAVDAHSSLAVSISR